MKPILIFGLCFVALCSDALSSNNVKVEYREYAKHRAKPFSLDTRYITENNSNVGYGEASISLLSLHNYGLEQADSYLGRQGYNNRMTRSLLQILSFYMTLPVSIAYHEIGHGSRAIAYDGQARYGIGTDGGGQHQSYFELLLELYTSPTDGAHARYLGVSSVNDRFNIAANGVNNEMYLSSLISDQLFSNQTDSVFNFWPYTYTKLSTSRYVFVEDNTNRLETFGDLTNVEYYYRDNDIPVSKQDLSNYNIYAYLLSASTWQYWKGFRGYLRYHNTMIKPAVWKHWRVPDVDLYLNQKGPSYQLKTAYTTYREDNRLGVDGQHTIPVAIEHVFLGKPQTDISIGYTYRVHPNLMSYSVMIYKGQAITGKAMVEFNLNGYISIYNDGDGAVMAYLGWALYDGRNLNGARHSPSLINGNSQEIWAGVKWYL